MFVAATSENRDGPFLGGEVRNWGFLQLAAKLLVLEFSQPGVTERLRDPSAEGPQGTPTLWGWSAAVNFEEL